ncbi:MAG TPA: hypothetical protein VK563_03030 [Puia sp.]|nr:hypothetical protein [Puia sp.]
MLLLLADALLLVFITLSLGVLSVSGLEKLFGLPVPANILEIFLTGLIASGIYFNMLSFWLPVNFFTLIPLFILSLAVLWFFPARVRQIRYSIRHTLEYVFSPPNRIVSLCLAATLIFYGIIPSGNTDSAGYHYLSILWYETYKVVPGLANIHARLAFNSVSFIIQAAYSFTRPLGQSIYPLNGVLTGMFFAWLVLKLLRTKDLRAGLIYAVLIFMFYRILLINISSTSSDALVDICMAYAMIRLYEILVSGKAGLSQFLIPTLVILYSVTAKLYAFPILSALPYIYFLLPKKEKKYPFFLKVSGICLFLYLPWMVRNYIMSGYIIYPFPYLIFFHPDWQVSFNVLKYNVFFVYSDRPGVSFARWFFSPQLFSFRNWSANLLLLVAAILSPLYWLVLYGRSRKAIYSMLPGWLIIYSGLWVWLFMVGNFRFGAVIFSLSFIFPFLAWQHGHPERRPKRFSFLINLLFMLAALYYIKTGYSKPSTYPFTLADCWLYPLKDIRYKNNKADFPYATLRNGVKLYLGDSKHECINTDLPCRLFYTGEIEMRGDRIDQGFRTIKDETLPYYPFIIK